MIHLLLSLFRSTTEAEERDAEALAAKFGIPWSEVRRLYRRDPSRFQSELELLVRRSKAA